MICASGLELAMSLTPQEQRILDLVGQFKLNSEIAEELNISPLTVSAHLRSIYQKLGVEGTGARFKAIEKAKQNDCY